MLIPRKMFRATNAFGERGCLYVLENETGDGGRLLWAPDNGAPKSENFYRIEDWKSCPLTACIEILHEIEISEGTEKIMVTTISTSAISPDISVGGKNNG